MSIYLIPFLLVTALLLLFIYAWLQGRTEQPDRGAAPATRHAFTFQLLFDCEWTTNEWGRRQLFVAINRRQLVVELGGRFGNVLHIYHQRRCTSCGEWKAPDGFVLSVWGRESCIACAEHSAYDFFQVNEHYGRADDLPPSGAWIPESLVTVYDEHARNVVW
jgi:hypothetical protein